MKSGTSWWNRLIARHPGVSVPPNRPKELHYFDRFVREPVTPDVLDEYCAYFPRAAGTIAGEWTPRYMLDFWVPPLLAAVAPNARILVLLRDPVERYVSGLTHDLSRGERLTARLAASHFGRGLYATLLTSFMRHYPREQILVLQYERCRRDTHLELRRTYEFLGLDHVDFVPADVDRPSNRTSRAKVDLDAAMRSAVTEAYLDEVARVAAMFPEIDPELWPIFRAARLP
jgi:hypothetical protein